MAEFLKIFVVVAGVVQKDGKFLMVQEKKEIAHGLWSVPAGRVEEGETLLEAVVREVKEETGYDTEPVKELAVIHQSSDHGVKHIYEMKIVGGELRVPQDEMLDVKWMTYEEIIAAKDKLRNPWVMDAIEAARA